MNTTIIILLTSLGLLLVGAGLSAATARWKKLCGILAFIFVLLASIGLLVISYRVFSTGTLESTKSLFNVPNLGASLLFRVDALSAFFLALIALICLFSTLYSLGYMTIYKDQSMARFYPFLLLFMAGMVGVVTVKDMFFFFVFWEFMTLTSWVLVIFEKEKPENLRAGWKYFVMTHIGTACMFAGAIILQVMAKSFSFDALQTTIETMTKSNPALLHFVLLLFFIGFGTKAGMYPLGTWLPDAHPAAPSGVSAILSGIMIKMGIYGFLRIFIWMLPASGISMTWGIIIGIFGFISMIMGSLPAMVSRDIKRMIAHSSIGQMGYIMLGLSVGITFLASKAPMAPAIAAIGIIAALYHLTNDAFYKALLFMNAGSVLYKTGTRDLNQIGGLIKIIPITGVTALIACLSLAGIPPFNAFVSKWLLYQVSFLGAINIPVFAFFGVVALFISVVTLSYSLKLMGSAFLGSKSANIANQPKKEVPASMVTSQVVLAIICILLGLVPMLPLFYIYSILGNSRLSQLIPSFKTLFGEYATGVNVKIGTSVVGVWNPIWISIFLGICIIIAYFIYKSAKSKVRAVPVWYCGEEYSPEEVRFKSQSFYVPIENALAFFTYPKYPTVKVGRPERLRKGLDFDKYVWYPFVGLLIKFSQKFRKTHVGIPQQYMLWVVAGIILVITILFLMVR